VKYLVLLALVGCQSSDVSRDVGARCDNKDDCNERCLADWTGGFCTITCDDALDCPGDAKCIAEQGGVCAFSCAGNGDCAFLGAGYTCQDVDSHGAGAKVKVCRGAL
jgi:hypothetical protein